MPKTTENLYRAIINGSMDGPFVADDQPVVGLLYPRFEDSTHTDISGNEKTSPADVEIISGKVQKGGGTSMFDVEGWFGYTNWRYFHVPNDTEYPKSLFIKKGKSVRVNKSGNRTGRHYQIEPRNPMTVDAYKGALDNFARNAVVRQVELSRVK
ncbi:MAG: hypothetical protein ACOYMG_19085 [Candidatus Methylumidiphilus sp.]